MDNFSFDLLIKIFIRIPIKSLLILRSVSKRWCNIIDDPIFARLQYDSGKFTQNTLLMETRDYKVFPAMTTFYEACHNEEDRMIQASKTPMANFQAGRAYGSCNGLICFAEDYIDNIVVSNPLRKRFMTLPPLHIEMYGYLNSDSTATGLGFDSLTNTFKMVRSYKRPSSSYFTLVHTLGTATWREVTSVSDSYSYCDSNYKSVFVHGFLHWRIKPLVMKNCQGQILAFDVSKETFKVIPSPEIVSEEHLERLFIMLDIKGNLAMLDLSCSSKIDVWIMEYDILLWRKEYTIDISILREIYIGSTQAIGLWKHDEILFSFSNLSSVNYWSYSMKTGDLKQCALQSTSHAYIYSLRASQISISGTVENS